MQGKFKVITLCGSTRFKEEYERVQKELTLKGNIVISVGCYGHSGDDEVYNEGVKEMLDEMHMSKIDMADEIFVINPGGYIGKSTAREISYAKSCGKKINSLEPVQCEILTPVKGMVEERVYEQLRSYAEDLGVGVSEYIGMALKDFPEMLEKTLDK